MHAFYRFLLIGIFFSSSLYGNKNIEWHLAMDWKTTDTPLASTSFKMAQLVKEMTNERFIIKIDGREKHASESSILDLVKDANYEMGHTHSSKYRDLDINTIWFESTPLGMTTKEQNTWFYHGNGQKFMSAVYDKFGVLSFPGGDLGSLNGGWSNKEINNILDFKNIIINSQGIENEVLMTHGAIIKDIPLNKIQESFQKNELNIITGTSPSIDMKMGYHKIAPYFYTSWDRPASQTQFIINKKAFENLPKNYQKILQSAMKISSTELYYENFYKNATAWAKITNEFPHIKVKKLPIQVITELSKTKKMLFEHYALENPLFKEIYLDQQNFLKNIRKWSTLEENRYLNTIQKSD